MYNIISTSPWYYYHVHFIEYVHFPYTLTIYTCINTRQTNVKFICATHNKCLQITFWMRWETNLYTSWNSLFSTIIYTNSRRYSKSSCLISFYRLNYSRVTEKLIMRYLLKQHYLTFTALKKWFWNYTLC